MKYLVLLGVIFAVIWWLKLSREPSSGQSRSSAHQPQNMVACQQCGLHLPEIEAVRSRSGFYCSEEHRALKES